MRGCSCHARTVRFLSLTLVTETYESARDKSLQKPRHPPYRFAVTPFVRNPPNREMHFIRSRVRSFAATSFLILGALGAFSLDAQESTQPPARAPLDQVLGTVSALDPANKSFTVKDDKTGTEFTVDSQNTRRFLKVPPGEKDLKKAEQIDFSQIAVGDRLLARGHKDPSAPKLEALIVIVMTAGDLEQKHAAELADWQKRGSRGVLAAVDPSTNQITMTERTATGPKTVTIGTTPNTQFTRYAPASVKYSDAKPSSFSELKPGDELRILGNASDDGSKITAERIISGAFATIPAAIVSISADGKQIQATNIQTKQPVTITLTDDSAVRNLPPMMAMMLARRMNGNAAGSSGAPPVTRTGDSGAAGPPNGTVGGPPRWPGPGGAGGGDVSQMIDRLPKGSVSDLKPGEQVVISGGVGEDKTHLTAINIISGVEPLFTAPRQGGNGRRSGGGVDLSNWSLDIGTPGEQ